jgi:hypothetical protein
MTHAEAREFAKSLAELIRDIAELDAVTREIALEAVEQTLVRVYRRASPNAIEGSSEHVAYKTMQDIRRHLDGAPPIKPN